MNGESCEVCDSISVCAGAMGCGLNDMARRRELELNFSAMSFRPLPVESREEPTTIRSVTPSHGQRTECHGLQRHLFIRNRLPPMAFSPQPMAPGKPSAAEEVLLCFPH